MVNKKLIGMLYGDQLHPGVLQIETADANRLKNPAQSGGAGFLAEGLRRFRGILKGPCPAQARRVPYSHDPDKR